MTPRRRGRLAECVKARIEKGRARVGDTGGLPIGHRIRPTRQDLADAVRKYFKDNVRDQTEPDFCVRKFNDKNILKFPGKPRCPAAPGRPRVTGQRVRPRRTDGGVPQGRQAEPGGELPGMGVDFEGIEEPTDLEEWLNEKLGFDRKARPGPLVATEAQKEFVTAALQALNVNRAGWPGEEPNP